MLLVIIRTLILYMATVLLLRVMGKRQIGQLQPYELVVIIMISELAAIPMQNTGIPLLYGIIPIFVLVAAQVALSYISLKSQKARGFICGKPSILIAKSKVMDEELKRLRYNMNDLLEQLRQKDIPDITDVEYAILETSGQLSVILKSHKRPVQPEDLKITTEYEGLPITLVLDGRIIEENLERVNIDVNWLENQMEKHQIKSVQDVLFAIIDTRGQFYYQLKSLAE
ncbi:YetF domain-containing protein [Syntrophomonas erecta]